MYPLLALREGPFGPWRRGRRGGKRSIPVDMLAGAWFGRIPAFPAEPFVSCNDFSPGGEWVAAVASRGLSGRGDLPVPPRGPGGGLADARQLLGTHHPRNGRGHRPCEGPRCRCGGREGARDGRLPRFLSGFPFCFLA